MADEDDAVEAAPEEEAKLSQVMQENADLQRTIEEMEAAHTAKVTQLELDCEEAKEKLADVQGKFKGRVEREVDKHELAWTGAIADRVAALPLSWSPSMVAKKIRDPEFVHPGGLADFIRY